MIPSKLSLQNFLSYGDQLQTVDFKNYSLMCLSGKNGNGKSALLDAITWALWGQARKISGTIKPDAGLLRLGATRMLVSFEFVLSERLYRVRREFALTYGKHYSYLDLEVYDKNRDSFVSLTDKTIRITQAKIVELLSLDYETFINSAFLRQGQANEFSKKSPKERKQILSTILGLFRYDLLQQKASEKVRSLNDGKKVMVSVQARDDLELQKEEALKKTIREQRKNIEIVAKKVKKTKEKEALFEKRHITFLQNRQELERLLKEAELLEKTKNEACLNFNETVSQWRKIHAQSLHQIDVEKLEKQKDFILKRDQELRLLQQKNLDLHELLLKAKDRYQRRFSMLEQEHEKRVYVERFHIEKRKLALKHIYGAVLAIENSKKEKETFLEQKEKEGKKLQTSLSDRTAFVQAFQATKIQFEKRRSYYQMISSRKNWLNQQLKEILHKKNVVHDLQNPSCPMCEQVLSVKRKQFLGAKFVRQEKLFFHQLYRVENVMKNLKQILLTQRKNLKNKTEKDQFYVIGAVKADELTVQCKTLQNDITILEKEIKSSSNEHVKQQEELVEHQNIFELNQKCSLEKDPELIVIKKGVVELETWQENLRYDKKEHQENIIQLQNINKQISEMGDLKSALIEQKECRASIYRIVKSIKSLKQKILEIEQKTRQFYDLLSDEKKFYDEKRELQQHLDRLQKERDVMLQSLGRLENEQSRLIELKKEIDDRKKQIKKIEKQIATYQTLAHAFGKNGIQALIIEESIPEIEEQANILLAKLTDNNSQIFIESLRDLKKGGMRETLDIKISDSIGLRPYEMYSGGEAFRIDFSLRIAISKLLARRAGTSLQTLIIDEGFGSQDEDGLQRLMDALYAIQDDFSKIIVVSHLPIFKENFPVHIIVEKGATGTVVNIEERG